RFGYGRRGSSGKPASLSAPTSWPPSASRPSSTPRGDGMNSDDWTYDRGVAGGTVLVVEDDSTVADVVQRYLERDGFTVGWVRDGAVGLERAARDPPDL